MTDRNDHDWFRPMPERLHGEREERAVLARDALAYNVSFLDEALRAILSHDLIVLGAGTGVGKTELALSIAAGNAMCGRATDYFALEAEPRELERRRKYALIAQRAWDMRLRNAYELNYTDWFLGRCDHIIGDLNEWADAEIARTLSKLRTFYRGEHFDAKNLGEAIVRIRHDTTMIVVDHLHYIDADEDRDENRAVGETTKIIREVSLHVGKPILLVVHLRKRDQRRVHLMPQAEDIHGSSNVSKISTQNIMLERALDIEPSKWFYAPTFISIEKDRRGGKNPFVALMNFNKLTKAYAPEYTLGRVKGTKWEQIGVGDAPAWALHHRPLEGGAPSTQTEIR